MKTIFFDWGGVIADDPGDELLTNLLRDVGASTAQIQEINATYMADFMRGKLTESEYWQAMRATYRLTIPASISDGFKKWSGLRANEELLSLVSEAQRKGWQTAILSNVIAPTYVMLQNAGLYERFDQVIASCEEGIAKPDQKIYEIALERLHTTPEESIFIDDKQRNLDPAKAMGFAVILAESPEQIRAALRDILD